MQRSQSMRFFLAMTLAGCLPRATDPPRDVGELHAATRGDSDPRWRSGMRTHYDDLRHVDAYLRAGRLAEARTLAYWLGRDPQDARVRSAAAELAAVPTLVAALRSEARIAGACGACHARAGARAAFERVAIAPARDGSPASHVRRHRWAAARVADGVIGDSELAWRAGLAAFTDDLAGHRVHELAARTLARPPGDRAATYGELLVACTACHPSAFRIAPRKSD